MAHYNAVHIYIYIYSIYGCQMLPKAPSVITPVPWFWPWDAAYLEMPMGLGMPGRGDTRRRTWLLSQWLNPDRLTKSCNGWENRLFRQCIDSVGKHRVGPRCQRSQSSQGTRCALGGTNAVLGGTKAAARAAPEQRMEPTCSLVVGRRTSPLQLL